MIHNQLLHQRQAPKLEAVRSHEDLKRAQRIVVKAGTSMIIGDDGCPCLPRVSRIIEEICLLRRQGRDVIFVCSGAVGVGRNTIRRQEILATSAFDRLSCAGTTPNPAHQVSTSGFAAAGQASLMRLLQVLFSQLDVSVAELLLTKYDFETKDRKESLSSALETLLFHGIVPIVNENDAVSAGYSKGPNDPFNDNDGLAALVAAETNADYLVLLTNVDGLFDRPPSEPGAKLIHLYDQETVEFGPKSSMGRGGMSAKIASACRAVEMGVPAVCITNGEKDSCITSCISGKAVGTLVVDQPSKFTSNVNVEEQAIGARTGGQALAALSGEERGAIMRAVAQAIEDKTMDILKANAIDVERAERAEIALPLLKRLALTEAKLKTLVEGIRSLADVEDPIGYIKSRTEISEGVELVKQTTPIGVLLIIFESRPDSLPQIAALSLRSGNGLLLKGGKEAEKSNACLHRIIVDAVHQASGGRVPKSVIGLVTGRAEIDSLLKLDRHIDLVIPRGSNALVKHIQRSTNIPVLGHADGICHTYIHSDVDIAKACKIVVDAKTNYPAACNATETVLIDQSLVTHGGRNGSPGPAREIILTLESAGVVVYGGPRALELQLVPPNMEAKNMKTEYGDNRVTVEVVSNVEEACKHINKYGSHHTDAILTEDHDVAEYFLRAVDSACVFHNCSTRMADGYRMGLGAEVGISTGRIHARGPVGVEGLLTDKWIMRSTAEETTATSYAEGHEKFTHKVLPLEGKTSSKILASPLGS